MLQRACKRLLMLDLTIRPEMKKAPMIGAWNENLLRYKDITDRKKVNNEFKLCLFAFVESMAVSGHTVRIHRAGFARCADWAVPR